MNGEKERDGKKILPCMLRGFIHAKIAIIGKLASYESTQLSHFSVERED